MRVPHVQSPPPLVPNPPQPVPSSATPVKDVTPSKPIPAIHTGNQKSPSPVNHALSFVTNSPAPAPTLVPVGTHAYKSSNISPGLVRNAHV